MFCICKYSEGINTKLYLHIKQSIDLEKDHFLSWLYIPDFCRFFISIYREGISIRNHTCTTRPTVHHEIEYFLSWLYMQDFCMFCISKYRKGINTKLHLHYKTKCTS